MTRLAWLVGGLVAGLASGASAQAQIEKCGQAVFPGEPYLAAAERYTTARLRGSDAVLVAEDDGSVGVVAFVRRSGHWRAYGITANGGVQHVYRSRAGDVFVWAYEGRGDPPSGYTVFHLAPAPGGQYCGEIETPVELNRSFSNPGERDWRGEYISFDRFMLDDAGRGAVYGSSDVERDGKTLHWMFRYDTADNGRTWSRPRRVMQAPGRLALAPVTTHDEALLADLKKQAR